MSMRMWAILLPLAGLLAAVPARAQFEVAGKKMQVHGFFSQGFAYSDTNNYLTMKTSGGSFALTDGGVNISTKLTPKLRVGAQAYSRNIGELTNGRVQLDWAYADYRATDWLGVRVGKVKTALGLYNDTQDNEFLHTWALLPQSTYPLDLRAFTIAHQGADLYGEIPVKKLGTFSYTAYAGWRPDDPRGGYAYGLADAGIPLTEKIRGWITGGDVRWTTPVEGLMVGSSYLRANSDGAGVLNSARLPFRFGTMNDFTWSHYVEYQKGNLKLAGEYRRNYAEQWLDIFFLPRNSFDSRSWFVAGSYRVHPKLELGSYHARFFPDWRTDLEAPRGHIYDTVVWGEPRH